MGGGVVRFSLTGGGVVRDAVTGRGGMAGLLLTATSVEVNSGVDGCGRGGAAV